VNLINVKRAERVVKLVADIVGLHVGLDMQRAKKVTITDMKKEIEDVASRDTGFISRGLNADKIRQILNLLISICMVGVAITKS
jgi:3-hexulose-6-phosphate synthase